MQINCNDLWNNCLKIIQDNISPNHYRTWFEPIAAVKFHKNILTIQVPTVFFYEYIEEHYIDLLKKTIKKVIGEKAKLEYTILMENEKDASLDKNLIRIPSIEVEKNIYNRSVNVNINASKNIKNPFIIPGLRKIEIDPQLNSNYNFANFIEGSCNRLARSAGLTIAENPGNTAFNPLFIYGGSGLGKTHLIHAIGIEIKEKHPSKTVLYVNANKFETQFTESTINNHRNDFLYFYQLIDVLLLDDIHELAGKTKTQDMFFHIFNHLHQTGKQLIIKSDKSPAKLDGISERLISRLKWGLSTDIKIPSGETKFKILQKKAYNDGIKINENILKYIAEETKGTIRELEGALVSIIAQSTINKQELTMELAREVMERLEKYTKKEISIANIKEEVSKFFNIPNEEINSLSRKREIVQARQIAMYLSKKLTKQSLSSIGMQIGNKDHATVLYACKSVKELMQTDKKILQDVQNLEKFF